MQNKYQAPKSPTAMYHPGLTMNKPYYCGFRERPTFVR